MIFHSYLRPQNLIVKTIILGGTSLVGRSTSNLVSYQLILRLMVRERPKKTKVAFKLSRKLLPEAEKNISFKSIISRVSQTFAIKGYSARENKKQKPCRNYLKTINSAIQMKFSEHVLFYNLNTICLIWISINPQHCIKHYYPRQIAGTNLPTPKR